MSDEKPESIIEKLFCLFIGIIVVVFTFLFVPFIISNMHHAFKARLTPHYPKFAKFSKAQCNKKFWKLNAQGAPLRKVFA